MNKPSLFYICLVVLSLTFQGFFSAVFSKVPCSIAKYQGLRSEPLGTKCSKYGDCTLKFPKTEDGYTTDLTGVGYQCVANSGGTDCECQMACGSDTGPNVGLPPGPYDYPRCEKGYCLEAGKKCNPITTVVGVGYCGCRTPCTQVKDAAKCSDEGGCPLNKICVSKNGVCGCEDKPLELCNLTKAPSCNGKCGENEICWPNPAGSILECECQKLCQNNIGCGGLCPKKDVKEVAPVVECKNISNTNEVKCDCAPPCNLADAPTCGGWCESPSMKCTQRDPDDANEGCVCKPDECGAKDPDNPPTPANNCNGTWTCPQGKFCKIYQGLDEDGKPAPACGCFKTGETPPKPRPVIIEEEEEVIRR